METVRPAWQNKSMRVVVTALVAFVFAGAVQAYDGKPMAGAATEVPKELEGIGIDEKLGAQLDPSLTFKDEHGQTVTLGSYFDGKTPVIISPVYYSCPGLCNFHLNGLVDGLKPMEWSIGKQFKMIEISFDSKETPDVALKKKATYMKVYGRPEAEKDWHFLTADEETIQKFTQSIGFKFRWSEEAKEWAHASAAIITTPKGIVSRYLPGIMFDPKDIKLALNEASAGKVGTIVDRLVLYCFQYDPHQSKYTLVAFNLVKAGGALIILVMAIWLLPVWVRSRRDAQKAARS